LVSDTRTIEPVWKLPSSACAAVGSTGTNAETFRDVPKACVTLSTGTSSPVSLTTVTVSGCPGIERLSEIGE
jgi:hypothetical protein